MSVCGRIGQRGSARRVILQNESQNNTSCKMQKGTKQYSIQEPNKKLKPNCKSGLSWGEGVGKRWVLAFYKAWRNRRGEYVPTAAQGNARFCWVLVSSVSFRHNLSLRCPLCIRYGRIKLNCRYVRTCAYRRKLKSPFLTEHLSVSSRLHNKVFSLFEILLSFVRLWIFGAGGFMDFLICPLSVWLFLPQTNGFRR